MDGKVKWSVILSMTSMALPSNGVNDILKTPHRMGISALRKPNTVCYRGFERPLSEMLQSSSKIFRGAASDPIFH
jgi:hypothetical protein